MLRATHDLLAVIASDFEGSFDFLLKLCSRFTRPLRRFKKIEYLNRRFCGVQDGYSHKEQFGANYIVAMRLLLASCAMLAGCNNGDLLMRSTATEDIKTGARHWYIKQPPELQSLLITRNGQQTEAEKTNPPMPDSKIRNFNEHGQEPAPNLNEKIKEQIEEANKGRDEENKNAVRTAVSLVFLRNVNSIQPAVVESFSLRNLIQWAMPNADPADVRPQVRRDLEKSENQQYLNGMNFANLDENMKSLLVDEVTKERLSSRFWFARTDIISFDLGITAPSLVIGERGKDYENHVDVGFPQFLFGLGLHYGSLQVSGGPMIYRSASKHFAQDWYVGINVDIYKTYFQLKETDVIKDKP